MSNGSIMRSNLNGTQVEELFAGIQWSSVAIALDRRKRRIYWADTDVFFGKYGRIGRLNYDGTGVEIIVPSVFSFGIAVDEIRGKLFFTDWRVGNVEFANLDGTERTELVSIFGRPFDIALDLRGLPIPTVSAWGFVIIAVSIVTIHVTARRGAVTDLATLSHRARRRR